jgi:opacity protein-like surface antigen
MSVLAQETPKMEVFGGYSNFSANINTASFNMNGVAVSAAENVNRWFGGALDFSAHFGTENGHTVSMQTISYGPVFSYRKSPRITPFGHVLLGAVHGGPNYLDISKGEYRFGMYAGGGLDVKVAPNVALRIAQVDYLLTRFSNATQDNFRISAGIVMRFGKK